MQWHGVAIAIHRGRRAEDQPRDACSLHGLAEHQGASDVVLVVGEWLLDALPYRLEPGEVNHGTDRMLTEQLIQQGAVAYIALDKDQGAFCQLLYPAQRLPGGIAEVIQHHHLMPRLQQGQNRMRADIAGTAGNQNRHESSLFSMVNSITSRSTRQVLSISASVSVGWHKNIKLVSPSSRATGSGCAGRQSVPSKAFSR